MRSRPKISVVTVCFNAQETIERTLRSVRSQSYPNVEYIIVDGGSTDGTLTVIDKYRSSISRMISEKDKGIYDAMNKGAALASGDLVYFLNADDCFCDDGVLADIATAFERNKSATLIYGNVKPEQVPEHILPFLKKEYQILCLNDFLDFTISHQAVFANRSLFSQIGYFDCSYEFAADYEWLIRAYKYQPSGFCYLKRDIANYFYLGRSYQFDSITRQEKTKIQFKHLCSLTFIWHFVRYVMIRGIKKRLLNEKW